MAQSNVIAREHRTLIGIESTFGETPAGSYPNAMVETVPLHDALHVEGLAIEMLEVNDARVRRNDAIQPIEGLKLASKISATFNVKACATTNILTGSGTVGSLSQPLLFRHCLGVEHAATGTAVATGTSTTVFDVASASNLKKGTWITVTIAGVPEPTKITNISTATVTVDPPLSDTPATNAVVRNLRTYAPAESHTSSMTWQFAFAGDSAAQYTANGCACSLKLSMAFGQLMTCAIEGMAATFTGPSNQSITTTSVTDDMSSAMVFKGATVILAPVGSLDRASSLTCESIEVDLPNQWQQVRDPGGVQTVAAVVNVAGRPRAATVKVRLRFDGSVSSGGVTLNGNLGFVAWVPFGSASTTRFFVVEVPNVNMVKRPTETKVGELLYLDLEFGGLMDSTVTNAGETGTNLDMILAPYRIAFG